MIIGGCLRLQVLFKNDYETFPNYRPKATRGCAAQPRAHPGSGKAGVYSVGCKYQPGGNRQTGRCWTGNFVSPLSYARRTTTGGLSLRNGKAGRSRAEVSSDYAAN